MDYLVEPPLLATLQAAVQGAAGALRLSQLCALAWHLRQRDGRQALALADEAEALLGLAGEAERGRLAWRLALLRSEIAALACEFPQAERQVAVARRLLREALADAPLARGDSWLGEAALAKSRGERRRELEAYARAVAAYEQGGDATRLQTARACEAYEQTFVDPAAADRMPEGQPGATAPAVLAYRLAARGLRLSRQDPAASAEAWLNAGRQAQRVGLIRLALVCSANAGSALHALGDLDGAAACYQLAERAARAAGWPALRGVVQTRMGSYLTDLGRCDEALVELRAAVSALAAAPGTINRANACSELAISLLRMGRAVEAEELMAEAIRVYRQNDSTDNLALNLIHQARLLGQLERPAVAQAAHAEALALIERHGLDALRTVWHEIGAELCRLDASLPAPAGWPSASIWHGEQALREGALLSGWNAPPGLRAGLAQDWAAQGRAEAALPHALAALQEQGAELARARQLLNAQSPLPRSEAPPELDDEGCWPAPQPSAAMARLSAKEREVLGLLARGYTNKEMALTLGLGLETVKWYLKRLFGKLQASSRRHAVARARTLGLA